MKKNATVKIVLDPQSKNETKSVKLRITFDRVPRLRAIPSDIKLTDVEFRNGNLKKTKEVMAVARKALAAAEKACDELSTSFTWAAFDIKYKKYVWEKEYVADVDDWDGLLQSYFIDNKLESNTRDSYAGAIKWVKCFQPNSTVVDVTQEFVQAWQIFMMKTFKKEKKMDMSVNTIGMYSRGLRAIYNYAVKKNLVVDTRPFSGLIDSAPRQKCSISSDDWNKFAAYKPTKNSKLEFAHDFALLSFALCGANMKDILSFKNHNVEDSYINFTRAKTERVGTVIKLPITGVAKTIMEKYGVLNPNNPDAYIFPYFNEAMSDQQIHHKCSSILKKVNSGIKGICEDLEIESFTTYNIRHTFAVLSRDKKGFTAEMLSKLLGHKNVTTTQIYLNSITQELMDDTLDFIDEMLSSE